MNWFKNLNAVGSNNKIKLYIFYFRCMVAKNNYRLVVVIYFFAFICEADRKCF